MDHEPFGTLYDTATQRPLRAATREELEASRQSFVRGDRGVFKAGSGERYVSAAAGILEHACLTPSMLASIIELLPIGVAVATDGTGQNILGNRRLEAILGMPVGRNISLNAPSDERPTEYRVFIDGTEVNGADLPFQRTMLTGEAVSRIVVDIVRADGVKLPVAMSAGPLRDEYGRIVGAVGVFHEVDDRDAAVDAARLSRDVLSASGGWYQAIVNALPEQIWAFRGAGAVCYFYDRTTEFTGRSKAELAGTGWMDSLHPDDIESVKLAWKKATANRGTFEAEFRVRRHDGVYRWFRARAKPVVSPDGETINWFATGTDIDDIKRETAHASILRAIVREFSIDQDVGELVLAAARHCVGSFASFCIFDLYDRELGFVRLAFAHADRLLEATLRDVVFEFAEPANRLREQIARAFTEHKTQVYDSQALDETSGTLDTSRPQKLATIESVNKIITPVFAPNGDLIGMLTFGKNETDGRPFDEIDAAFAEEIARLLSGTFGRSRSLVRTLQRRQTADKIVRLASPVVLPTTRDVSLDAIYSPGRATSDAGISWYDAIWISATELLLSSGKITGGGIETAVAAAILSQALRAAAFVNKEPTRVMAAVEKIVRSLTPRRHAAAFFGLYEPSLRELRYVLRGHPLPVLRLANGSTSELPGARTTPLGFGEATVAEADEYRQQIGAGALLVLRTADVSPSQPPADFKFNADLIEIIERLDPRCRPASAFLDSLCGAQGCSDDVAVLTVLFS